MQVIEPSREVQSYSDETGHYIQGFLIGTRPTNHERNNPFDEFTISKATGHEKVKSFQDRHFAIVPELIKEPGEGGHPWAIGRDNILKKYEDHSHGVITKILGPYSYNDGTDDYYYNFRAKLAGSKAASVLMENGAKTWIPYAVSPHIWDFPELNQDAMDLKEWEGLGVALVIKGAYGPDAVITKLCKGDKSSCDKGLGASVLCEKEDEEIAQFLSSLVGKSASVQTLMDTKDIPNVPNAEQKQPEPTKVNPTVEPQKAATNAPSFQTIPSEELAALKERAEAFTEMENERKSEILSSMFSLISDEKERASEVKEFAKYDMKTVKAFKSLFDKISPLIKKQSEQEGEKKPDEEEPKTEGKKKGKAASIELRKEPEIPKEETGKAASVTVNEVAQLRNFMFNRRIV